MICRLLVFSVLSSFLFSCITPGKNSDSRNLLGKGKKKKSASIELPDEPASPEPGPAPEDLSLFLKVSDLRSNFTTSDIQSLRKIAARSDRSPLNRAILLFGVLRSFLKLGVDPVLFDQAALLERTPVQGQNWASVTSLEALLQGTNISIKSEFDANPFVQTLTIVELASRALDREQDKSSSFVVELRAQLHEKATQWANVREKLGSTMPVSNAQPTPVPDAVATSAVTTLPPAPVSDINPANYTDSELIKKSTELAEKSRYRDAIQLLRHIDTTSPYSAEAKKRIHDLSNKAVSELRTKAARSFQAAGPITDLRAKGNYLSEAENYLLRAIEEFPDSDQLETVKQNLSTIQKSLKVINKR